MAPAGQRRLVVGRRAALLPQAEHQVRGADDLHGAGGPLRVSDVPDNAGSGEAFIAASNDAGYPDNADFNGADAGGRRLLPDHHGAAAGAARPRWAICIRRCERPNLRVETGALAAPGAVRGQARGRASNSARTARRARVARAARGDPVRRRDQLAAASAAVGRRAGRRSLPRIGIDVVHRPARRRPGACRTTTRRRIS